MDELRAQEGPQKRFLKSSADIALYGGAAGGGKLLPLDTKLPTPVGWVTMGRIKEGDKLFDELGNTCTVLKAHDIVLTPELYRFTFDDGSTIDSCVDHLWHTYTAKDLSALTRRTDEYRKKRRNGRESFAKGNKSIKFTEAIIERNKKFKTETKKPPTGSVKSTIEIVNTLKVGKNGRNNHAIKVSDSIKTEGKVFKLDPYLLGLWLGDGTASSGTITTADQEITEEWNPVPSQQYLYRVPGLTTKLRKLDLINNKHVPDTYLRGSREQRLSLLQGLMDTDGTVDRKKGNVTFDNTDEVLVNAVIELACSLGHKPGRKTVKKCTLHGKKCKDCYSVTWTAPEYVFRLKRKIDLQKLSTRRTTKFRYIVKAEKIESRPGRCITVDSPNGLYLAGERFVPTHNTFALLMEPIYHMGVPGFGAVIFRRTTPQVRNEGGLWDTSMKIYPLIEGFEATPKESTLEWSFPPYNNKVKFAHLEYEKNKLDWQGSQIPLICFDELTHFTQSQFFYLLSRNRSMCGVKPYIRATTNPDADSWVASFIDWWIDDDGFPIEERSGVIRWFIRVNDAIRWGDSKEDLESNYPGSIAKSFTFIPAKLEDNKILEETDPAYRANLRALSYVDNERLEKGNWKIKPEAGTIFKRAWFEIIEPREVPHNIDRFVRFWDLAGTEATKANKDPDWTVGLKLAEHNDIYYILDVVRVQVDPFEVKATVKHTCNIDGYMVPARMEQEPGSSGKAVIDMYRSEVFQGYNFDGLPSTGSKVARANPVSIAAGAGRIKIVRAPWNEGFLSELEYFPDGPHDDQVDGLSGAFNFLNKMNIGPTISEPARMQKRFRPGKVKKPIIF